MALKRIGLSSQVKAAVAVATWGVTAFAVPGSLTQQGRILTTDGEPVDGSVTIVFTIYDAAEAGDSLWTETQSLTLDDGYFSAALGDETAIDPDIFDGSVRYLGVKVGADDEMTPRQAIRSVPYAFHSLTAESVPFNGLTGVPTPCSAPQFLRGYASNGDPDCGTPTLSCTTRYKNVSGAESTSIGCETGEVLTGGGCSNSSGSLVSSGPSPMCPTMGCAALCLLETDGEGPTPCVQRGWFCRASTNAVTAFAHCCRVQ